MKQSIWLASAKTVEQYKKYKVSPILGDVLYEFRQYSSFDGVQKGIILGRMLNAVKQSLRVRGVNSLFRMRTSTVNYEKQITGEIRDLQTWLNIYKKSLKDFEINGYESIATLGDYLKVRDNYLTTKIRLESKILERKNIRSLLKTTANDILKEKS